MQRFELFCPGEPEHDAPHGAQTRACNQDWLLTTLAAAATGERAVYPASIVTLDEMRRATEAMALHEALYARALALFFRRAEAVERVTGVRLLCE